MKTSPTQRTLKRLRSEGFHAAVVEKWNAAAKVRQDLFGFIDVLALHPSTPAVIAVQATSAANVSARVKKIKTECHVEARACLDNGWRIEVWGWKQVGRKWAPVVREILRGELGAGAERSRRSRKRARKSKQQELFA